MGDAGSGHGARLPFRVTKPLSYAAMTAWVRSRAMTTTKAVSVIVAWAVLALLLGAARLIRADAGQ